MKTTATAAQKIVGASYKLSASEYVISLEVFNCTWVEGQTWPVYGTVNVNFHRTQRDGAPVMGRVNLCGDAPGFTQMIAAISGMMRDGATLQDTLSWLEARGVNRMPIVQSVDEMIDALKHFRV